MSGLPKRSLGRVRAFLDWDEHRVASWSQEGEDLILARHFEGRREGFYVDVGAHHPTRFSNTYRFYQQGWRGINIDAAPGSMAPFRRLRPRDTNLELGVGASRGSSPFHVFNEPALSTFDPELARSRTAANPTYTVEEVVQVPTAPLGEILVRHLPPGTEIDFMTVDVEGHDLEVLASNDWSRYRPELVLAELPPASVRELLRGELVRLMEGHGYDFFGRTILTGFFRRSD
jgi:FkbM family methyltransferase